MRVEEIEVTIDPEGKVQILVKGLKGSGCLEVTKPLEDALGGAVESRTYTSEYYESNLAGQHLPEGQKIR